VGERMASVHLTAGWRGYQTWLQGFVRWCITGTLRQNGCRVHSAVRRTREDQLRRRISELVRGFLQRDVKSCVVGTLIRTNSPKDGMTITVDGLQGVVCIDKR